MRGLFAAALALSCLVQFSVEQECSTTKLCPAGCCSSAGFCGYGPDYCGKGCQSNCERKSDCNPGWDSNDWSKTDKCPLNVCCSKHGFCGYTEEFCKGNEVKRPSCSLNDNPVDRVIGYYEGWATAKRSCYAMRPEEIPFGQYTHIIFSFATINPKTFEVSAGDSKTEDIMSRIGTIKILQPDIKIWVAIGGWAFNDPGPTQTTFSDMAASDANMEKFLSSLAKMMNKYGFDGIDIDWEYPVATDRHGRGDDYANIVTFMKKLRRRMKQMRKGVSMALPASYWYLQHFDLVALEDTVDWFNLMTYDMHGAWDIDNKFTGPWANSHTNLTEIQLGLDLLWRNDINPKKVTIGMSYYSRSFTLTDPGCSTPGCQISSAGEAGKCSGTAGVLLHPEIQDIIKEKGLKPTLHRDEAVKTVSWGNQWVSFDDIATWRLKGNKLRSQCITGFMVWAISQDDKKATNAQALVSALGRPKMDFPTFEDKPEVPEPVLASKSCRWTSCFEGCPSGFKEVQRDGHKEIMMDASRCGGFGHGFTRFCCPTSEKPPTCSWRGHKNSGKCSAGCKSGEVEVGTLDVGCKSGYQSACCSDTMVTSLYGKCVWLQCNKLGKDACGGDHSYFVTSSSVGSGGAKSCSKGQRRSLCCTTPAPFDLSGECKWQKKVGFLNAADKTKVCEGACPPEQLRIALESGLTIGNEGGDGCFGDLAYCCAEPVPVKPRHDGDTGSAQAKEFRTLLEKYMENPTCPATILYPTLHDKFTARRRSLQVEASEYAILQGRAKDCTLDNWVRLVRYGTLLFSVTRAGMDALAKVWDSLFADSYDTVLRYSELHGFLNRFPGYEPRSVVEYVLYNPTVAGPGIRRVTRASQVFCELPTSRKRKIETEPVFVENRGIDAWYGGTDEIPSLETIFKGIFSGRLSLHYARWIWYRGTSGGLPEGPMLELAYWIGSSPGVGTPDATMDIYQDMTRREPEDRWVVFHLHSDPTREWLHSINGRTYFGTNSIQVFHGQYWRPGEGYASWRVYNGDGTLNRRDGFDCDRDLNGLWYVGSPRDVSEEPEWSQLLQRWGERIYGEGYLRSPGLGLILESNLPSGHGEEIDPENPGTLSRGSMATTAAGHRNPYLMNWLIDSGDLYNFFTAAPPSDLQDPRI